ncbi:hypothetical protein CUBM_gp248c [Staphylococcus phage CUB-M]|nr:hypothetical protein CUBM_gp248c [Staphylococcus phage CUB-M]
MSFTYSSSSSIVSANLSDCKVSEVITTASWSCISLSRMLLSKWSMYSQIRACFTLSSVAMLITISLSLLINFICINSFSVCFLLS